MIPSAENVSIKDNDIFTSLLLGQIRFFFSRRAGFRRKKAYATSGSGVKVLYAERLTV